VRKKQFQIEWWVNKQLVIFGNSGTLYMYGDLFICLVEPEIFSGGGERLKLTGKK